MNNMEQPSPELQALMRHSMTQELRDEIDAGAVRITACETYEAKP